jgi:ABC-2 type transport system permease protein
MTALGALTERVLLSTIRDLDLPFAVLVPAGLFIGFNIGLRNLIDTGAMSYAQYVLPLVIVQVVLLGALTAADRAAREQWSELGLRLRTLPMLAVAPLMARMLYSILRGAVVIVVAIATASVFGFRMTGGYLYDAAFVLIVLTLTLALSLGGDALGAQISRSEASSQLLMVPQLVLIVLSTGMAPADAFPDWLHPFVSYQPVSQVTETLRGLADGNVADGNLATTLVWCIGMLVLFGGLAVWSQRRTRM